ncbi:carbonate dehydratase [Candidatus Marinamargulisbacteria bacterium SCGC AAA071-K20]|nr:carbonate dehydratase [Candidatus Marinamargulisbacteria bacterium SCGC AAA071-K20]
MTKKTLLTTILTILIAQAVFATDKHWSYKGSTGPETWGRINKSYEQCSIGKTQSPINITNATKATLSKINIDYLNRPLRIINNGHTIQVNYSGGKITVGDETYNVLQFHFHSPGENQINGKLYPMEMHLVHKRTDGALGVLAVMIEKGKANATIQKIWGHLPRKAGSEKIYKNVSINASNLLPKSKRYYRFMGSLTTPPCTEGVNWHVLQTPITLSKKQIKSFESLYKGNNRPIQAQNNRLIMMGILSK